MTLFLALTNILVAIITIAVAIPLIKGRVPKNGTYGVRIPLSMKSDEHWYPINRYGGKCLIGWSVPVLLIGIGLLIAFFKGINLSQNILAITVFSLTSILIVGALPQTLHWAQKNFGDVDEN